MKIVSIVGTRPQFVKAAVVSRAMRCTPGIEEVLVHTGQHYDANMSDVFFDEMEILRPGYNLGIGSATHGAQTGRMLEALEGVLLREKPDWTLVYGDSNSTLAGAIAAVKLCIPVIHVEAGLRSFNRQMPEEINRVLADHASDLLFAPTEVAVNNLKREGIPDEKIHWVGDVMYDAALYYGAKAKRTSDILRRLHIEPEGYILATVHRAENTDDSVRLRAIFAGLGRVAMRLPVIFSLHPRTREAVRRAGLPQEAFEHLHLIDPVGYLDMMMLERSARLIVTDSGGVQKEAFFYKVPCVTLREDTEWVELVELGWNRLVPPQSADAVERGVLSSLESPPGRDSQPYGDGRAAEKIVRVVSGR